MKVQLLQPVPRLMDLQEGGTVTLEGNEIEVEPDEFRIHGALWKNGAMIEVCYYPEPDDDHPSDRMELKVCDCNGIRRSWRLNVEDALEMIEGLSKGIKFCLENKHPFNAEE